MDGSVEDLAGYRLEKADYDDFYIVAIEDARAQIEKAESILSIVEEYIKARCAGCADQDERPQ